jgi:sigma-B regulation protein RsbU (phosphoserine phosphatase)
LALLFLSLLAVSIAHNGAIGGEVARRKELQRDLRAAQRIQRALIPSTLVPPPGLDMAVWCRPSRELGGDCVDLVTGPHGRCWLFVGDVSGKGIASAIVMSNVQAQFRTLAKAGLPIGEVARHIDEQLAGHATNHYVTGVLLLFDPDAATLEFLERRARAAGPDHRGRRAWRSPAHGATAGPAARNSE